VYEVPTGGAETGTPFGLLARMDAHFPGGDLKKYRQKYRHFSKRPHCWGFETLDLIVPRRYLARTSKRQKETPAGQSGKQEEPDSLQPFAGGLSLVNTWTSE